MILTGVALLGCSTGDPYVPEEDPVLLRANRRVEPYSDLLVVPEESGERVYPNIENFLEGPTPALTLYREDLTRAKVTDFFVEWAGSGEIALPILYYAEKLDIPNGRKTLSHERYVRISYYFHGMLYLVLRAQSSKPATFVPQSGQALFSILFALIS